MNLRSIGICAVLGVPLLSQAQGMAPTLHPETFCPLGAKMGMATGPFDKVDFPGCSSPPKAVTANRGRSGLQNTLAFYSMSQPDKVQQLEYLSLLLNVNNPQEAKGAYAALLPAATTLSVQVLGEIPKGLEQAIMAGQSKSWKSRGWRAELKRKEFSPASNGHQLTYRLYPAK